MKEILEKILSYLPQYLADCGSIFVGPKTFVLNKVASEKLFEAKEYFLFLALTVAIITIVSMLHPVHDEIYIALAKNFVCIGFVGYSFAVRAAFWLVGGRASYEKFFAAYTYIASPMLLANHLMCSFQTGYFVFWTRRRTMLFPRRDRWPQEIRSSPIAKLPTSSILSQRSIFV